MVNIRTFDPSHSEVFQQVCKFEVRMFDDMAKKALDRGMYENLRLDCGSKIGLDRKDGGRSSCAGVETVGLYRR